MNELEENIKKIDEYLIDLMSQIEQKTNELNRINEDISISIMKRDEIIKSVQEAHDTYKAEKTRLEASIKTIRKENKRIKQENSILIAKRAELQKKNIEFEQGFEKIEKYEKKALASLEAKDKELIARENNIRKREQLRPLSVTFLPPNKD